MKWSTLISKFLVTVTVFGDTMTEIKRHSKTTVTPKGPANDTTKFHVIRFCNPFRHKQLPGE